MSDSLVYPALVVNRKFASNGQPFWKCEMRFAADDVEMKDAGNVSKDAAVEECRKTWPFIYHYDVTGDPGLSTGQTIYRVQFDSSWTLDPDRNRHLK